MLLRVSPRTLVALLLGGGAVSALVPAARAECKACKAQAADWDWKANGYALADSADAARAAGVANAIARGCPEAYRYLDAKKLACAAGCTAGEKTRECAPKGDPPCTGGSYEKEKDMWLFVCRKAKGAASKDGCDAAAAAATPFFAMCDAQLKATDTLPCNAPACAE
jgi:hypothetical protein